MKKFVILLASSVLVAGLAGSCSKINERLDEIDKKFENLDYDKIATVGKQLEAINASISDLGTIREEVRTLSGESKKFKEADEILSERIGILEDYVSDGGFATTEWVKATFSTLEQYYATCDAIAEVDEKIGKTSEKLSKDITDCAESLKQWVNEQLGAYYTAAQMDAKLSELYDKVETDKDSLAREITKAKEEVAAAKEAITKEYKAAISEAIKSFKGEITKALQDSIETVNGKIAVLASKVSELADDVAEIKGMVQSIEFVPEYAGSNIIATYMGEIDRNADLADLTISYKITPESVVRAMFMETDPVQYFKLYLKGVVLDTKAGLDNCVAIKTVIWDKSDRGMVHVVVDHTELEGLFRNWMTDKTTVSLALGVNYGISDFISAYTDLSFTFKKIGLQLEEDIHNVYRDLSSYIGSRPMGRQYNPYRTLFNMCGDDVCAQDAYGYDTYIAQLNDFTYKKDNEVVNNCYFYFYKAVDVCNKFLDTYSGETPTPRLQDCIAQVRVLRAWLYMTLAIGWNNPPLVLTYPAPKRVKNTPHDVILDWCAKECKEAIPDLPERTAKTDREGACVVTKGFALGVCGKAQLFAGKYSEALASLKPLVESDKYELVPGESISTLFHVAGNGCEEKIFEFNMKAFADSCEFDYPWSMYFGAETRLWSCKDKAYESSPWSGNQAGECDWGLGMNIDQAHKFLENDGDSYRRKAAFLTSDETFYDEELTAYKDPEYYGKTKGWKEFFGGIGISLPDGLRGQGDVTPSKLIVYADDVSPMGSNKINFCLMRLGEAYLLYAEACLREGQTGEAKKYINKIQERAGAKTISGMVDMDVLKDEKEYELWMEGCRWADIMRWQDERALNITLPYAGTHEIFAWDEYFTSGGNKPHKLYYKITPVKENGAFNKNKHRYFPYPTAAVNSGLQQNPLW